MALKSFWKLNTCAWVKGFALLIVLFSSLSFAEPSDIYAFSSEKEKQRFWTLTKELRCLVCQNQSLADSDADLAKDLRAKVYLMLNEKKSDEEIREFLVSRYGAFILFSPPLNAATLLLWSFPALLLLLAFGGVFLIRRR
jgi:cytochrome c-type biogenesis protein CcmH